MYNGNWNLSVFTYPLENTCSGVHICIYAMCNNDIRETIASYISIVKSLHAAGYDYQLVTATL